MSVLIITRTDDNLCVDLVQRQLAEMGETSIRFDTDRYPTQVQVTSNPEQVTLLKIDGTVHELTPSTPVWYRRYFAGGLLPMELGENRDVCVSESRRTLYGMIAALEGFQLDPLICVRKTDHKELQLKRGKARGLTIPRTIFSNDEQEIRDFFEAESGEIVTKMQSSFAVYPEGEEMVVFTTKVTADQLSELEHICYSPMIFQEFLPKKLDIRSTVVGKRVYSAAIDSQKSALTTVDWRRDGANTLDDWFPYTLPPETEKQLLQVVEDFGLNYAAADFVETTDDRLVFLEINAGGEWLWKCSHHQLPIDRAIAEVLTGRAERTPSWPWFREGTPA